MKKRTVSLKIYRYDPDLEQKPSYSEYKVDIQGKTKLLDLLKYVYKYYDDTLAFRSSCNFGKCGSCAVTVNGRPVLACQEYIDETHVVIEPLTNFPVVKDLIIDRKLYSNKLNSLRPFYERLDWDVFTPPNQQQFKEYKYYSQCIECLSCISKCPAYKVASQEFAGPAIFTQLAKFNSNPNEKVSRAIPAMYSGLHNCTTCKSCTATCTKEIDVFQKVIEYFRGENAENNMGIPVIQSQFVQALSDKGRLYAPFGKSFTSSKTEVIEGREVGDEVGLFLGCVYDARLQKQAEVLVDMLVRANYRVIIPKEQQCCGGPLIWTGQKRGMREQLYHNIHLFEKMGITKVVTPCPGCGMTLKYDYPEMFEELEGRRPSFIVMDVSELLVTGLFENIQKQELNMKITFHDPCHLKRGQKLWNESRRILESIPGIRLIEMKDSDQCCGGMTVSSNKNIAERLGAEKASNIAATNAEAVVTSCPNCYDNIRKALIRNRIRIPVYMVTDILGMAMPRQPQ